MILAWKNLYENCANEKLTNYSNQQSVPTIVCSRWEDPKRSLNIFAVLHQILTQLVPINWSWKLTYYTKNLSSCNFRKPLKPKNCPLSKAYCHVVCVPNIISTFHDITSTWLLHDCIRNCSNHICSTQQVMRTVEKSVSTTVRYLQHLCTVGSEIPTLLRWSRKYSWHK